MKRIIKLISLIFLIIPLAYSITLQELIDSYDYSYSEGRINGTNIIHYGNDTNNNGLFDYLIINLTGDTDEGNYTFIGDLYKDNQFITTISDTYSLTSGRNTMPLYYNSRLLQSGTYNLSLTVQEKYLTIYRENYVYSFYFDNTFYEKPVVDVGINGYDLVDNDLDGKYELLRINTLINSSLEGIYEINALIANSDTINSKRNYSLVNGTNSIAIDFSGKDIRQNRINNSRLYLISVRNGINSEFDFNYPLDYNLYDFDARQSILEDTYIDGKVDLNGNNLSEFLEINISLDINESGTYSIEMELNDIYDNYVKKVVKEFYIGSSGKKKVIYLINGTEIYNSRINGPYLLEYVKLSKDNITLDLVSEPYTTDSYNYDEFERPSMPDLVIDNIELENVSVSITNEGSAYAFAFNVELFDDDFNSIGEMSIPYLAPGDSQTVNYDVNVSNNSMIYAVVDYDDDIEEENESNNLYAFDLDSGERVEFNISLIKGWNLISFPLNLTNKSVNSVFESTNFSSIFSYGSYYYNETYNNFDIVNETKGYWVESLENQTLTIDGTSFNSTNISLKQGWNLIGYLSLNSSLVNETLNGNYSSVYGYNGGWLTYFPDRESGLNSLNRFVPGYGYWVKVG